MVNNDISATLEFKDGKIFRHRDSFDFWRWSRQSSVWPGGSGLVSPLLKQGEKKKQWQVAAVHQKHSEYHA